MLDRENNRFQAFLFDLDGTLIDSEPLWIEALGVALQRRGVVLSAEEVETMVIGRAWPDIFAGISRNFPDAYPNREAMEKVTAPLFDEWLGKRDIRIHDSVVLLKKLAELAPVAIVSGSTRQRVRHAISLLGIEGDVCFSISCEDYSPGKPSPAGYLLAAERLDLSPCDCLVFEDSPAGVQSALSAGMPCVALCRELTSPILENGNLLKLPCLGEFRFRKLLGEA